MPSWTLLHTADWHLGHALHGHDRGPEHAAFLGWLEDTIHERDVDLLVVAGDVFDARTPPAAAQALLYAFLARARSRRPSLEAVLVAGNHDSPSRLTAPRPLLEPLGVRVFGTAVPGAPPGDLVIPVHRRGERLGTIAAIPYLRPSDLAEVGDGLDPARVAAATGALHAEVSAAAARAGGAVIGVAHCEVRGAILSPKSERAVAGGGTAAPAASALVPDAAYVALGHLHHPQWVGTGHRVRYAGSPIALALDEASYAHSVSLVRVEGGTATTEIVAVPRTVGFVRIPAEGTASLTDALDALTELPPAGDAPTHTLPFVEVHVRLDAPERALRSRAEAALAGRAGRLTRIVVTDASAPVTLPRVGLDALDVREMVVRKWHGETGGAPPDDVLAALDEAIAAAAARLGDEEARRTALIPPAKATSP